VDQAQAATERLGAGLPAAFLSVSFLGLEVIPSLKLTDQGLVDVEQFAFVPLWVS
jgi:adenine deaminase